MATGSKSRVGRGVAPRPSGTGKRFAGLVLSALLPVSALADGWETTEWYVACDTDLIDSLPDEFCAHDADRAAVGPAAATRAGLEDASVWLEGLGFREPRIDIQPGDPPAYKAYLSNEANTHGKGDPSHGIYDPAEWRLSMSSDYHFAIGEGESQKERQDDLAQAMPATAAMVHELFHAVQRNYQSGDVYHSRDHDWIFEGTAEAVALAWLKRSHDGHVSAEGRSYEYPLHRPRVGDGVYDEYGTFHFWFSLGEVLGSTDRVQYLDRLLDQDLSAHRGLAGIDMGLRQWHSDGLYALYPTVMARFAMQAGFFDEVTEHVLTFPRDEQMIRGQSVRPVATRAHRLKIDVPKGKTAGLAIRFAKDERPDLHLLVDRKRRDIDGDGTPRNVHRGVLHGPRTVFVRVANVAPVAIDSTDRQYDLEVRLRPLEPCGMEAMEAAAADTVGRVDRPPDLSGRVDGAQLSGEAQAFVERMRRSLHRPGGSVLPGEGRLSIQGVVTDAGIGCSGHLAATTVMGRAMTDREARREFDGNLEGMQDELNQLEEVMGEDGEEMDQTARQAAAALSAQMAEQLSAAPKEAANDVVLPVYSPNVSMWQAGRIRMSQHEGVGGWRSNAAANFLLRLPGTPPEDLREGQTYEAVAVAPLRGGTGSSDDPVVSPDGFYARWKGEFEKIPVPTNLSIRTMGYAFQGVKEHLYGRLNGAVTVEELTGASVEARFRLSGEGTLLSTRYIYDCDVLENYHAAPSPVCSADEYLTGSLKASDGETRTSGPVVIEGNLRAPNRSVGGGVRPGYQNVVIE